MEEIKTALKDEILDAIKYIGDLKVDSEEYQNACKGIKTLVDTKIAIDSNENDNRMQELDKKHMSGQQKIEIVKIALDGVKLLGGVILFCGLWNETMTFEETGILRSGWTKTFTGMASKFVKVL